MGGIREYHLFAGIGGGIYGGRLLGHKCVGAVEIMPYARAVLAQRKRDGWMDKCMDIDTHTDITKLNGKDIVGQFDVLCGGFPCQAFSTAAHGKNIAEKNLWDHMLRVVKESHASVVFGENVVLRAIEKARHDLECEGYAVQRIRLGCEDLGADHRRNRFWLLAVRMDEEGLATFKRLSEHVGRLPKLSGDCWTRSPDESGLAIKELESERRNRLLGVGNAQSPLVAATAFRILVNRHLSHDGGVKVSVTAEELSKVFEKRVTWITKRFRDSGEIDGLVHTPTTMANYCCASMVSKHQGCRNYLKVFCGARTSKRPEPVDAEYLMGFPIGASCVREACKENYKRWRGQ